MIIREESIYEDWASAVYSVELLYRNIMSYKNFQELVKQYISEINYEMDENDQMVKKAEVVEKQFVYAYVNCRLEEETEDIVNTINKIDTIISRVFIFRRHLRNAKCFISKKAYEKYYNGAEEVLMLSRENKEGLKDCAKRSNSQYGKYINEINSVPYEVMNQIRQDFINEKEIEEDYEEDEFDKLEEKMLEEEDYL